MMRHLFLAAAATGILTMAFELARSAWMARVVPVDELSRANASLATGTAISEAAAFAAAGVFDDGCHGANRSKRRCPGP